MNKELIRLEDKILSSKGMKCINLMNYHNDCISILSGNSRELIKALLHFEDISNGLVLMDQNNRKQAMDFHNEVTRLLHNFLASAKMLIEHTRIFMRKNYSSTQVIDKYNEKIKNEYANNELNIFIQELRNYILHRGLPFTGLLLKPTTENGVETTIFLDRDQMLEWSQWSILGRNYLSSQQKNIRLYSMVKTYLQIIDKLHVWLNNELEKYHEKDLNELHELQEQYRQLSL